MKVLAITVDVNGYSTGIGDFEFITHSALAIDHRIEHQGEVYTIVKHPLIVLKSVHNGGSFSHNEMDFYEINVRKI